MIIMENDRAPARILSAFYYLNRPVGRHKNSTRHA